MRTVSVSMDDLKLLMEQEDKGIKAEAMYEYARRKKEGEGCIQNYNEAVRYYESSAALGNPSAARELGIRYTYGLGVKKNAERANKYLEQAADKNDPAAMYTLFQNLSIGDETQRDLYMADQWLKRAAEQHEDRAEAMLRYLSAHKELCDDFELEERSAVDETIPFIPDDNNFLKAYGEDYINQDEIITDAFNSSEVKAIKSENDRRFIIYVLAGIISGFLVAHASNNALFAAHNAGLVGKFSSTGLMTFVMVILGIPISLLGWFLGLCIDAGNRGDMLSYIPILLMPVFVAKLGYLVVAFVTGIFPIVAIAACFVPILIMIVIYARG